MDTLTTIQYYNYGVNPNSFRCNSSINSDYHHLISVSTTSTQAPPSSSTDFVYFHWSLVIWALTPALQAILIFYYLVAFMFDIHILDFLLPGLWKLLDEMLVLLRITRNKPRTNNDEE